MIGMVLGTDMTAHFDTVGAIKAAIASHGYGCLTVGYTADTSH